MNKKTISTALVIAAILNIACLEAKAADSGPRMQFGLEIPVSDSPGVSAPAGTGGIADFGNFFLDLFERFGLFGAVYPVNMGSAHLGLMADVMWHYSMDADRTPATMGLVGTLGELSAGLILGTGGKGITLEAVFQNRTGLQTIRYGVARVGVFF